MIKPVIRGFLLIVAGLVVGTLQAQTGMDASIKHRVLTNPQMQMFNPNQQPSAEQWAQVVSDRKSVV